MILKNFRNIDGLVSIILGYNCEKGEIPLKETQKCQLDGYTCTLGDGENCCIGREEEIRMCIPCDETMYKKLIGTRYNKAGTCEYESGVYLVL